ncbi:MAG TPA: DUF362 domain-containing protein [Nitrospira sp.]|jgi:uncharacterized protein (DUF362 family)|nr:DUF362 domain-containing protein [Nitrospira sp.]
MSFSRRELFHNAGFGLLLLPAILRSPRNVLGHLLFDPGGPLVTPRPRPVNPFKRNGKSLVAIVYGKEPSQMLQRAMNLLGGMDRLDLRGKRVLLKPNVLNDRPPPSTTNPQVVGAMAKLVKQADAADVIVADGSGIIRLPTSANLTRTGMRSAAEAGGARVLALEDESWVRMEPPEAHAIRRFYFSQPVYDADVVINMPVIKTHRFAEFSCSLKNIVGAVHPRYRPSVTFWTGDWHERIAELNLAVHPQLTVVDGTTIMIEGGPTAGAAAQTDLIISSGDRLAVDLVAVALLRSFGTWPKLQGKRIEDQRQLKHAAALGLGTGVGADVTLLSDTTEPAPPAFHRLVEHIQKDLLTE